MSQIVSATMDKDGNIVLVVKKLPCPSLSKKGANVHCFGTVGWSEKLGLTYTDPEGNEQELRATVDVRYINPYYEKPKPPPKELTVEDLKNAGK